MKLIKARVQNFRCVEDSGEFDFHEQITCLVGKNESGKTALLTALYFLNPMISVDVQFDRQKDYPRRFLADYEDRHPDGDPAVIITWWRLEEREVEAIQAAFGNGALNSTEVCVSRGYNNTLDWSIDSNEAKVVRHLVEVSALLEDEKLELVSIKTIHDLTAALAGMTGAAPRQTELLQRISKLLPDASVFKGIHGLVTLPKFLFFTQYQRLRGQVSLEAVMKNSAGKTLTDDDNVFLALCDMAGTTIQDVATIQQFEYLVSRFEGASNKISNEIFHYWSQNRFLKVQFRLDPAQPGDAPPFNVGRVFRTRIHNQLHEVTVPFDDRSNGFVWFFSFLALFSQMKKHQRSQTVILLDEPGLSLHGKAQGDLLRYFNEKLAPDHQVVYTTHSPFMVPTDNILSVRTVEDVVVYHGTAQPEVHGTKVGSDVLSTDRETLFPLQGALGYEITQSLFVGEHTLIVEGPSDLLYLKAVSAELLARKRSGLDPRWTICPAGGIDKIGAFMTLFGGNRLHVAVLTDFASGQKKKIDELRRSQLLRVGHVLTADAYAGQAEADVEDMLGAELYIDIINSCYGLKGKQAATVPASATRVVKYAEEHFRGLPSEVADFDHYAPASHFTENRAALLKKGKIANVVLDRFERLFSDLRVLLPA